MAGRIGGAWSDDMRGTCLRGRNYRITLRSSDLRRFALTVDTVQQG